MNVKSLYIYPTKHNSQNHRQCFSLLTAMAIHSLVSVDDWWCGGTKRASKMSEATGTLMCDRHTTVSRFSRFCVVGLIFFGECRSKLKYFSLLIARHLFDL